jgi:hypothetical protein
MLLLSACSIEHRGAPGTDADTELTMGEDTEGDTVSVTIAVPSAAAVGDEVPISIVVQNNRARHVDLNLTGREIVFDVVIARADSTIVWQRLRNATTQQILQLKTLGPNGSFTLYERWQPTEAGKFIISAELPTDGNPLQAEPVNITIR